ncbi:MAG: prolyl oligopeptidase family serine peptidase [Victivallales bacterium]|nr:prolyl oligopeptidase family serine peptidase [Victivallales bacterium]
MRQFEYIFDSIGCQPNHPKKITVLAAAPDRMDARTGALLVCHGWGTNRYQHLDILKAAADRYNLFCIAPEFRMSGYDYDPLGGYGWYMPYDMSFYQTFDALLALRFLLQIHPELNRHRLFSYGGSQGGHIVLLGGIFAPHTFAAIYASSSLVWVTDTPDRLAEVGRDYSEEEKNIRSVPYLLDHLDTPLFMEHGTADDNVSHLTHTALLEKLMKERGKPCEVIYYEGGNHDLAPTIKKVEAFHAMAAKFMDTYENNRRDDFASGSVITIPCGAKTLTVDWGKEVRDEGFMIWK